MLGDGVGDHNDFYNAHIKMGNAFYNKYKERVINRVPMVGSHDSGAFDVLSRKTNGLPALAIANALAPNKVAAWTITQSSDIAAQLVAGVRAFDFRVAYMDRDYWLCHTFVCSQAYDALQAIAAFLYTDGNENDVVILRVAIDGTHAHTWRADAFNAMITSTIGSLLYPHDNAGLPTLQQMVESGSRVLLCMDDNNAWPLSTLRYPWFQTNDHDELFAQNVQYLTQLASDDEHIDALALTMSAAVPTIVKGVLVPCVAAFHNLYELSTPVQDTFEHLPHKDKICVWWIDFADRQRVEAIINNV